MHCIKCGREIKEDQAFCEKCQEHMAQRPVKPDVVVQLPLRKDPVLKKHTPRKKVRTLEEQILRLKKRNRWLTAVVCLLTTLSLILAALSFHFLRQLDVKKFLGQNYSTAETVN